MEKELDRRVGSSGLYYTDQGHLCIAAMPRQLVQREIPPDVCHSVEV
jgi:hypothetical protein